MILQNDVRRFENIISTMDIPVQRKRVNHSNLYWFLRNGAIANRDNAHFAEAVELATQLLNYN